MINNINTLGKFLDQPILISKLNKAMPKIMTIGALGYLAFDTFQNNKKEKDKQKVKKEALQKGIILASTIASALITPKIAGKITKRDPIETLNKIKENNSKLIDNFINTQKLNIDELKILNKAKEKSLSFSEVKKLIKNFKTDDKKEFLDKLIPNPENIKAKDIFSEIGYLSVYGAMPVIGGIVGGVASDKIIKEDYKEKMSNRINEGIYQYLANIFMCNIGAGISLGILEKMNITSKSARAIGMTTGIILSGIVGGSKIANFISNKFIQPIISPDKKVQERKPEAMDLCLHTDDIATVSLLSGLKWIEPALPILYSVSGYKAGSGYRN